MNKGGKDMTATELQKYLRKTGKYRSNGFKFAVEIIDARFVYTRLEFRIVPLAGEGDSWVMASFVTLDEPPLPKDRAEGG
jgi:hypothetical protein